MADSDLFGRGGIMSVFLGVQQLRGGDDHSSSVSNSKAGSARGTRRIGNEGPTARMRIFIALLPRR